MERVVMWAWQVLRNRTPQRCHVMSHMSVSFNVLHRFTVFFFWPSQGDGSGRHVVFSQVFLFLVGFRFDIGMYRFQYMNSWSTIQITANSPCGQAVLEFEQYQKNVHVWALARCYPLASKISKQSHSGFCGSPFSFSQIQNGWNGLETQFYHQQSLGLVAKMDNLYDIYATSAVCAQAFMYLWIW